MVKLHLALENYTMNQYLKLIDEIPKSPNQFHTTNIDIDNNCIYVSITQNDSISEIREQLKHQSYRKEDNIYNDILNISYKNIPSIFQLKKMVDNEYKTLYRLTKNICSEYNFGKVISINGNNDKPFIDYTTSY